MTLWQTVEHGFRNWKQMTQEEKRRHTLLMQQLAAKDISEFSEEDRRSMEGKGDLLLQMIIQGVKELEEKVDSYLAAKTDKAA